MWRELRIGYARMGITTQTALWLAALREQGVDFTSTITLGRQTWNGDAPTLRRGLLDLGIDPPSEEHLRSPDGWADHYFRWLGAEQLSALDTSDYEGADVVADLNRPLPELPGFSVVLDGGTIEHVVNVFAAFTGAMSLVAPGGHLLSVNPTNGECGHGFYQFSPSLYWGLCSADNGFRVDSMLIDHNGLNRRWFSVAEPRRRSDRVGWNRAGSSYLHVVASRLNETGTVTVPQQDDYALEWEQSSSTEGAQVPPPSTPAPNPSGVSRVGRLPRWLRGPALRLARVWRPMPKNFQRTDLRSLRL